MVIIPTKVLEQPPSTAVAIPFEVCSLSSDIYSPIDIPSEVLSPAAVRLPIPSPFPPLPFPLPSPSLSLLRTTGMDTITVTTRIVGFAGGLFVLLRWLIGGSVRWSIGGRILWSVVLFCFCYQSLRYTQRSRTSICSFFVVTRRCLFTALVNFTARFVKEVRRITDFRIRKRVFIRPNLQSRIRYSGSPFRSILVSLHSGHVGLVTRVVGGRHVSGATFISNRVIEGIRINGPQNDSFRLQANNSNYRERLHVNMGMKAIRSRKRFIRTIHDATRQASGRIFACFRLCSNGYYAVQGVLM